MLIREQSCYRFLNRNTAAIILGSGQRCLRKTEIIGLISRRCGEEWVYSRYFSPADY